MATNGGFKQIDACLLSAAPLIAKASPASNLLWLISAAMLLATIYAGVRKVVFKYL